ncbi:MAG: hypothetical protein AABX38_00215 [Candidatus Micrarchaeota archaeon]
MSPEAFKPKEYDEENKRLQNIIIKIPKLEIAKTTDMTNKIKMTETAQAYNISAKFMEPFLKNSQIKEMLKANDSIMLRLVSV